MEQKFYSSPPVLPFKEKNNHTFNTLLVHNFRINVPEDVNTEFTKYNFYFINGQKETITNNLGFEKAKKYKTQLMTELEKNWNEQQQGYSPSKRSSFENFCKKHNTYVDVVLPGTRQEWFEQMGICQFTDEYVWDKFTETRKMGKLIPETINKEKLWTWAKTEINFMKQWMNQKLGTDKGFLYATVHLDETTPHVHFGFMPITKVFSKTLNQERYVISNNKILGGNLDILSKYHANYLTKVGFGIYPGLKGSRGSYNAASFREIKVIERNKIEAEIQQLLIAKQNESNSYDQFKRMSLIKDYYDNRIEEIRSYLLLEELSDYEKNQIKHYLILLEKVRYFKILKDSSNNQIHSINLEHYEEQLDKMTIKLAPILTKSYRLTI
ncbi:plasmid recombination protein [Spiroplasma sp. AdecLV25b]|uniref:plasmid recombination protein n=1 Tax=Spiroplasma sp. AdecLV25b TaxID=3027162 RepID=UPI0027E066BA|nr:plasmid recombination protein [Spiroplasma sp. AdecLV25b]